MVDQLYSSQGKKAEYVVDRPGQRVTVKSSIAGEVERLREVKAEKTNLENIQGSITRFNQFYERNLHLIEASTDAERKIEELAEELSQTKEEVVERLLKISIRSSQVKEELAADFFLDEKAEEADIQAFVNEEQLEELKLARVS